MKFINDLKALSTIEEFEKYIKGIFQGYNEERYIPAIIDEGDFITNHGEDFYLKLVLAHHNITFKKTWLKQNVTFGIIDPSSGEDTIEALTDLLVENVITTRNVKGNRLYQLNPLLVTDSIEEYEYNNNQMVNSYFHDEYSSIKGLPVLQTTSDMKLMILKDVLFPFINELDSCYYPKYKLIAEYEYRTYKNQLIDQATGLIKTDSGIHDILVDNKGLRFLGSIEIDLNKEEIDKIARNIKVIDLETGKERLHNPNNFNDDTNAGFVVFERDILSILKEKYYFYDLMILDKTHVENQFLIDVLSDKVVFWEGEYNKLLQSLKDIIDKYNFVPGEIKNIISPGMMAWQLESDWDYHKKLYPEQILAWKIHHSYFNSAIEIGITFLIPESIQEFKDFINGIERITDIKLESFDVNHKDVKQLIDIRDYSSIETDKIDLELIFRKYCYQIYKVLIKDDE